MKNLLLLISLLFVSATSFGQYAQNTAIDPNQKETKQYIQVSYNGKQLFSNAKKAPNRYRVKGHFESILLTDFADALGEYLNSTGNAATYDSVVTLIDDAGYATYDSVATLISEGGLGYDVYVATISQSGANPITLNELENTIGVITSGRADFDTYTLSCTNCFTENKTWVMLYTTQGSTNSPHFQVYPGSDDAISITGANALTSDTGILYGTIEIRVYP